MRLIDADALTKECGDWYVEEGPEEGFIGTLEQLLSEQPEINCSEIPNNSDTISRQAAIDALRGYLVEKRCPDDGTLTCRLIENEVINKLPSAQPERPRGHWVETGDEPYDEWECDVCGFAIDGSGCIDPEEYRDVYKFCPNCGADMRGDKHEDD